MRRRRRWTPADKRAYLAQFAASGLSIAAFCRETAVPESTFALWRREARESRGPRARRVRPGFAAVELVPSTGARGGAGHQVPGITIVVREPTGRETELTGLDAPTAMALVRVVLRPRAR